MKQFQQIGGGNEKDEKMVFGSHFAALIFSTLSGTQGLSRQLPYSGYI